MRLSSIRAVIEEKKEQKKKHRISKRSLNVDEEGDGANYFCLLFL